MRLFISFLALLSSSLFADDSHLEGRSQYEAPMAAVAPVVDGSADDPAWAFSQWRELGQRWLGPAYTSEDFNGRYKIVWTAERLYLLVEFTDDILYDGHRDPLVQYWDDDCLEIFIDEDYSGGEHRENHNAFAYHFSLDNQAIDIGTDGKARAYNDHVSSQWRQEGDKVIWEVAIDIYTDAYEDDGNNNLKRTLTAGKTMGLMVAYCDNDGSELRENFIGSEPIQTGAKDRGYIDAGVFGALTLVESSDVEMPTAL
ncbi:MAG: sugar-binding protein [Pseudomonadota bacterium]